MPQLSQRQFADLTLAVNTYLRTVGTYDYPRGRSVRLKTGRTLERRGLVELANQYSANRYAFWLPTELGRQVITLAKETGDPAHCERCGDHYTETGVER